MTTLSRPSLRLCLLALLGVTGAWPLPGQTTLSLFEVTSTTTYASDSVLNAGNGLRVGSASAATVTLTLADVATLTIDDVPPNADTWPLDTVIGHDGAAVLQLFNKATLVSNAAQTWVGGAGDGTLSLAGNSRATFNGQLIVGGYLDGTSTGTLSLTDGAELAADELWLGAGNSGALTANNDATLDTTTVYLGARSVHGNGYGSASATLTNGAEWTANEFYLGYGSRSSGTLTLSDNATLSILGETSRLKVGEDRGTGVLVIDGGTVNADNALIGGTNGNGTVNITSDGTFNTQYLNIGYTYTTDTDATGAVNVTSGDLSVSNTLRLGETGTGTLLVSGANATATVEGDAYIGSGNEGGSPGQGTLTVANGGEVTVHGTTRIGNSEAATGLLTVSGNGSAFRSAGDMEITAGSGASITDGGLLRTSWLLIAAGASLTVSDAAWELVETATIGGVLIAEGDNTLTLGLSGETRSNARLDFGESGVFSLADASLVEINLAFLGELGAGTYTIATFAEGNGLSEALLSSLTFVSPDVGYTLTASITATSLQVTAVQAVPEPGTWAMLAAGLGLLGLAARRRRR